MDFTLYLDSILITMLLNFSLVSCDLSSSAFNSVFKVSKFEFTDIENETSEIIEQTNSSSDNSAWNEFSLTKSLNLGDLFKSLGYDPEALIKMSKTGDVVKLRRLRSFVRRSLGSIVSPGCIGDLLFFVDTLIDYALAQFDSSLKCLSQGFLANSTTVDCGCTDKTEKAFQESQWALNALDSYGKISAGFVQANLLLLGDFEQCTEISVSRGPVNKGVKIEGQYCRLDFSFYEDQLYANVSSLFDTINEDFMTNLDSGEAFILNTVSNNNGNGCSVSRLIKVGTCFPRTCSKADVRALVGFVTNLPQKAIGKQIICSSSVICHEDLDIRRDLGAMLVAIFILIIVILLLFGTLYDYYVLHAEKRAEKELLQNDVNSREAKTFPSIAQKHVQKSGLIKIILAFSLYSNGKQLFSTKRIPGQIDCLHGIRALSMFWIILGHTYYWPVKYIDNPFSLFTLANKAWNQIIINSSISVDAFYTLSATLLVFLWLRHTKKTKGKGLLNGKRWALFYFYRYVRLTPVYAFIMAIDIFLVRYLSDGPLWNQKGLEPNFCENSWWINMLYMNNFFSLKEQCMTWTWYLANDMQFYALTPPILILLWSFPLIGLLVIGLLLLTTSLVRTFIILWAPFDYPPISILVNDLSKVSIVEDFWADVYIKPYCRCGPYIVGLLLGYLLYRTNLKLRLPKWALAVGWICTTAILGGVLFGLQEFSKTGQISLIGKAIYSASARPLWALAISWIILTCSTGCGGVVDKFLSARVWFPISRLVYCAYLVHPIVILSFYSSQMRPIHYDPHYGLVRYINQRTYKFVFDYHIVFLKF